MKTFTFKYDPSVSLDQMFVDFKNVLGTKKPRIEEDAVISQSIDAILSSMNKTRLDLFYCIAQDKPSSLYQLSKILKRDYSNVFRDAKALKEIGIIDLQSSQEGERGKLVPVALYDRIVFDFGATSHKRKSLLKSKRGVEKGQSKRMK